MSTLEVPKFKTYEEEAAFWDNLDTALDMEDDGEWFRFETPNKRAFRVAILPELATELAQRARVQDSYQGDLSIAILAFLRLHEKYGWKEQLRDDVRSVRAEVRRQGGVKAKTIEAAIKRHRRNPRETRSLLV